MKSQKFDLIIAMNLMGLAVLTVGYGLSVVSDIPAMQSALSNQPRLVPMPEVIEFSNAVAVVKGGK